MTTDRTQALLLLDDLGASQVPHSGRSLLDHLLGTADVLASWGACPRVELAGLLHSVYGTGSFEDALLGWGDRHRVVTAVGQDVERLVYLYCRMDVPFLEDAVSGLSSLLSRDDWSALPATGQELENLVLLVRANRLEQNVR